MDDILPDLLIGLYVFTLLGMSVFGLHKIKMLWLYFKASRGKPAIPEAWLAKPPVVCVQCPLFNEPMVVEALLESVTALHWSATELEIQILDDSTDETPAIIERWLAAHPERALRVKHIRRTSRNGYKAGALAYGMTLTQAEFFAIFDADFRPAPDFLDVLMPQFVDAKVGVVQARWEFCNRRASLLTRFQSIFLDAHFIVEQEARHAAGLFFNFNGTAGIWRRAALEDAGGWTSDTVTEDLDASYRAQLRGWRFVYLPHYSVPSELPETLTAFKLQQRRWTKGGIQVMRKQLGIILRSNEPARIKREAANHLLVGLIHPLLVLFVVLFVPSLLWILHHPEALWSGFNPVIVVLTGGTTVTLYVVGQYFRQRNWREGLLLLISAPFLLAFGLAMSITGCVAVLEGMWQRGGEFARTPKGGLMPRLKRFNAFTAITLFEFAIGFVLLGGSIYFGSIGHESVMLVLGIKALAFLTFAAISTFEMKPWSRFAAA